jgi:hypothetical protein
MHICATDGPESMDPHDRAQLRLAAIRALRIYPGPVGRLVQAELNATADWGYRLLQTSLPMEIMDQVMTAPMPPPAP